MVAMRASASSRKPPVSPALIMLTMRVGKWSGCEPIAADSVAPCRTSARTRERADFSPGLLACSSRMASERRMDRPAAVIDANCRVRIARSLGLVRFLSPGMLISRCSPDPALVIDVGVSRRTDRACATASALSDSMEPLTCLPAESSA